MAREMKERICATRALKNARYLQKALPGLMPADEPLGGFRSIIPDEVLSQLHLHQLRHPCVCPHSKYATQYGPNTVTVAQNSANYAVTLQGTSFNAQQFQS